MNKTLSILLFCSSILLGCEKPDIPRDYPSAYTKLPQDTISKLQIEYIMKNPYLRTSLNEFGFCDETDNNLEVELPPYIGILSKAEAEYIAKEFISRNTSETGVTSPEELTFSYASTSTGYGGSNIWHIKSANQKIDTIEVLNT